MLAESYLPRTGGGVRFEADVVSHFRSLGHTVDVVTVNHANRAGAIEQESGGRVIRLPRLVKFDSALISAAFVPHLRRVIGEYDVVHFNSPNPIGELAFGLLPTRVRARVATVCSVHHAVIPDKPFARAYNGWFFPKHLSRMGKILVGAREFADNDPVLRRFMGKVRVVPYGVDVGRFRPDAVARPWRKRGGPLRLLFVGRLVRYKGVSYLLQAMANVESRLEIVGEGVLEPALRAEAETLGLADRVSFLGRLPDDALLRSYQAADVILLPSVDRGESFGYVLAEAMACGAAAVSTEIGTGTSVVNRHDQTGFVVAPRDSDALATAIRTLDTDRDRLDRFRANARTRAVEHFSLERMLRDMEALYAEVALKP